MSEDPQREKVRGLGRHDLHGKGRRGKKKGRTEESERNERGKGKEGLDGWKRKSSSEESGKTFREDKPRQERSRGPEKAGGPETGEGGAFLSLRRYRTCV